jgi:GTP cyclohydrolase I
LKQDKSYDKMLNNINEYKKNILLPDIQNNNTDIKLAINKVGITNIVMPVKISTKCLHTITSTANFSIYVDLNKDQKGTHMSRFITKLQEYVNAPISSLSLKKVAKEICIKLESNKSFIECSFKYFINKQAPISKLSGLMDYDVTFKVEYDNIENSYIFEMIIKIPVTAVCPCSKEIAIYGAHNQRGIITISFIMNPDYNSIIWIEDIIKLAERCASCELYPILKREDEKFVTEQGYDNANFVEDTVRKVAKEIDRFKADEQILNYRIESMNYESIHNHEAFAMIRG